MSILVVFQAFFEDNSYAYIRLNPLESKKQLDSLRVRKTDKIDAEKLATSQFILNRKPSYVQEALYQELRDLSRFYQNLTEDIVCSKTACTRFCRSLFLNWKTSCRHQLGNNIGTWSWLFHVIVLYWS